MSYTIGIDVGGTFTDCVLLSGEGLITTGKAPSTPPDFWQGVLDSIGDAAETVGASRSELLRRTQLLIHGTTIAENALVTGSGARAGLLTTRGFEDTLLIMRVKGRWVGLGEEELTQILKTDKPEPIIPRALTEGVSERIDADGEVVTPLDPASAEQAIDRLLDRGARAIAISLLWSFVNPAHEQAVAALVERKAPGVFVTRGSEIAPYAGEYERTATAAINAYLGEIAGTYIGSLCEMLAAEGLAGPVLMTQGYGGALRAEVASGNAVGLIESGPAAGMIASQFIGEALGYRNVIATDMGGTTFKVGLIADGMLEKAVDPHFGKYNVMVPKIDVRSIGAGGGSIVGLEEGSGAPCVGPAGAGAVPGPVCYGLGGTRATLTDADLALGYLNPEYFLGGKMRLDRAAAEEAIARQVAEPLGISVTEAAAGIYNIACSESADLIRRVSIERGYDPREFILFAYGGAGPVHAGVYAQHLGIARVLVPFTASVHCAMGAVCSDIVREYGQSEPLRFPPDPARVNASFAKLAARARDDLRSDGCRDEATTLKRFLDLKFGRQVHVVRMAVPEGELAEQDLARLQDDFVAAYERRYGPGSAFRAAGVEIVNFVVEAVGHVPKPALRRHERTPRIPASALVERRLVYFVDPERPAEPPLPSRETPVYRLPGLVAGNAIQGPAIVETPVTTIVVQPSQAAEVDEYLNVLIDLEATA
jgi:N-methylhydantoinase A